MLGRCDARPGARGHGPPADTRPARRARRRWRRGGPSGSSHRWAGPSRRRPSRSTPPSPSGASRRYVDRPAHGRDAPGRRTVATSTCSCRSSTTPSTTGSVTTRSRSSSVRGASWLQQHPERDLIITRYLAHQQSLVLAATDRLAAVERLGRSRRSSRPARPTWPAEKPDEQPDDATRGVLAAGRAPAPSGAGRPAGDRRPQRRRPRVRRGCAPARTPGRRLVRAGPRCRRLPAGTRDGRTTARSRPHARRPTWPARPDPVVGSPTATTGYADSTPSC